MVSTSLLQPINGCLVISSQYSSFPYHDKSSMVFKWGLRKEQVGSLVTNRTKGQAFRVLANPNRPSGKGQSKNEVIMVDPLEAKKLAAIQMQQIQAKEKLKRRRQIEAINGAWAIIGLTAGIVIEGRTGKSILNQLAYYWTAIINIFV